MTKLALPLIAFVVLVVFLAVGLTRDPSEVPSPLIDKAAPTIVLPLLSDPQTDFRSDQLRGQVWLLNVWASWCPPCRAEHPLLLKISQSGLVPIYGLNYKDEREDALKWLRDLGDPYVQNISDADGRLAIDYGVYGVPETFLIDRSGVIRFKQVGPITEDVLREKIVPLVKELQK